MGLVILVPKLSVVLNRRVELGNCVDDGKSGRIARGCGCYFLGVVLYTKKLFDT